MPWSCREGTWVQSRKGWQVLGTAGAHGQGGFAGWQQVLAALMGLGLLRVRGGASTSLPSCSGSSYQSTQCRKALVVPFPVGRSLLPASRQPAGMRWDILGKIVQGIVEMLCFDDDDDDYFFPH